MSTSDENFLSLCSVRLKEERKRLGLSQQAAAELCDVSREIWGKYERGVVVPGGDVLFSFSAVGADVGYIFSGVRTGTGRAGYVVAERPADPLSQRKAALKAMIDQADSPAVLEAIQEDIEKIERMRALGREEGRRGKKAG